MSNKKLIWLALSVLASTLIFSSAQAARRNWSDQCLSVKQLSQYAAAGKLETQMPIRDFHKECNGDQCQFSFIYDKNIDTEKWYLHKIMLADKDLEVATLSHDHDKLKKWIDENQWSVKPIKSKMLTVCQYQSKNRDMIRLFQFKDLKSLMDKLHEVMKHESDAN